ncbi:MAG: hypothetical protein K2X87_30915 [Gemmataceae bacterium]|nr:hypothetical protein [Gemmataceae bacterium]
MVREALQSMADHVSSDNFRWVISTLLGLLTAVCLPWLNSLTTRQNSDGERLTRVETLVSVHVETLNDKVDRMAAKQDRLEAKLEEVLTELRKP